MELQSELAVLGPPAFGGQPFARVNGGQSSDDGDQVAMAASFDPQYTESIFFVEEGDSLDEAG
jgi:hypothetical protein